MNNEYVKNLRFDGFASGYYVHGVIDSIRIENGRIKEQQEKLLDLYLDGKIDKSSYTLRSDKFQREIDKNNMLIADEEDKIKTTPTVSVNELQKQHERYDSMTQLEKRKFLFNIIDYISLDGNKVHIKYKVKLK